MYKNKLNILLCFLLSYQKIYKQVIMNIASRYNLMTATKHTELGETIECQIRRQTTTNEPIDATAPIIFTPRKDGVVDEYNIRADKWDVALKNMEQVARNRQEQRAEWQASLDGIEATPEEQ